MILIVVVVIAAVVLASGCPEVQTPPCRCTMIGNTSSTIICEQADEIEKLRDSMGKLKDDSVRNVVILNSAVTYLPHDLFVGFSFQKLFLANSTLVQLSDSDTAFKGLENHLKFLRIEDCPALGGIDWNLLRNMRALATVKTINVGFGGTAKKLHEIPPLNVAQLLIMRDSILILEEKTFAGLKNMSVLSLKGNFIFELDRSMFPNPAENLRNLILSSNKISALPEDFFTNMPKLVSVSLADNAFTTIHEQVFLPIWSQLNKIDVLGNPMRCDCRLKWIVGKGMPKNFWGNCEEPQEVKGKEIKDLGTNDLWC